jgi:hypothetical protein
MLAEPVGLGKTFTALAVAEHFREHLLIAAPSSLRSMWESALEQTKLAATIVTHEALSRDGRPVLDAPFIIVDEAHRLRTSTTRRYSALADLCRRSKVLLVTATPVQNRRADLAAQLALYLGRIAWEMTDAELAEHVVRSAEMERSGQPALDGPHRITLPLDDDCLDALLALPPPIPARDESLAIALQTYGLVHQWTSSRAALIAALLRRRARGVALLSAVEAGRRPTRTELSAWTQVESAVQLAFPELVTANEPADVSLGEFAQSLRRHDDAIASLISSLRTSDDPDRRRADALLEIRRKHTGQRIIAFCQYAETVAVLRERLAFEPGVAALTARGARVAGGRISRAEVIAQFSPGETSRRTNDAERIDLLITTDLLSEGLNLQEASVIVHLDLPWNPARLEQRVGRARRLGSRHDVVSVYSIAPPASAERMLRIELRLREKLSAAQRTVGVAGRILPSPFINSEPVGAGLAEQNASVSDALSAWINPRLLTPTSSTMVAAIRSAVSGFLALVREPDGHRLVADIGDGLEQNMAAIRRAIELSNGHEIDADEIRAAAEIERLQSWLAGRSAAATVDFRAATTARARRSALARVARAIARAPRHQRARLAPLAAAARSVASAPMAEGAERILELLVESELPDEAWLRSIAAFGELNVRPAREHTDSARVIAVILFGS